METELKPLLIIEPDKEIQLSTFQLSTVGKYDPQDFMFLWHVHPMLTSKELDVLATLVKSAKIPDMLFGYNRFYIVFPLSSGLIFEINPLQMVDLSSFEVRSKLLVNPKEPEEDKFNCIYYIPTETKIQFFEKWKNLKLPENTDVQTSTPISDWSYSAPYMGTFSDFTTHELFKSLSLEKEKAGTSKLKRIITDEAIPTHRLTPSNPVIKFWEIPLFDDELNDNGLSSGSLRLRVMKDCIFGLIRHYLRVDNVLVRIIDTRIFHSFDTNYVLRDFQVKESTYDTLKSKGFTISSEWSLSHSQSDMVSPYLDLVMQVKDKIVIDK